MVYVPDITSSASVLLPRPCAAPADLSGLRLTLVSTYTRQSASCSVPDIYVQGGYWVLEDFGWDVVSEDFDEELGEFEYSLESTDGSAVYATGIIVLGPVPETEATEYEKNAVYEQYNG